ncbi:HNH endonuclease [Bradyrhizobium sp. 62B]|nr:HNH endonuclease [Bradyrhizobium sp. 62B]
MSKIAAGDQPTKTEKSRYRHPQIKAVLVNETHGKCAYCESKLLHIHHGDVEHIYPKSLDPARTLEWENLTLACEVCNQNKSDHDPFLKHVIDPYNVDPAQHLLFTGSLIFPRGTVEGESTRTLLDLNRGELAERRKEHLEKIMSIVGTIMRNDLPIAVRRALFGDLAQKEAGPSGAYSAMTKAVIMQITPSLPDDVIC